MAHTNTQNKKPMKEDIYFESLDLHEKHKGKIEIHSKVSLESKKDLSLAYTPGVSQPCVEIHKDKENVYKYTSKGNLVAVISDGTSVLGLGDIGPYAAIPVMEGKSILFKKFANIDAFPICLDTKNVDELVKIITALAPVFGGILLEDISAPRCFEIEKQLIEKLDIPVFHDDQHGTAIVVAAALINCLKLAKLAFKDVTIVINGAGAAGIAIAKLLIEFNAGDILLCDTQGIVYEGRVENMSFYKNEIAALTNKKKKRGTLADAMRGAHVFVGVSKPYVVSQEMVKSMAPQPIICALSNPIPEIMPEDAKEAGAFIVCTGRSDFANQVNNVLAFPGIFRGALDKRAKSITLAMKKAAAIALANLISPQELSTDYVIPKTFDPRVAPVVAQIVAQAIEIV
jgi:malate dehydrogenase (oxaloacetate-decarboxylating)